MICKCAIPKYIYSMGTTENSTINKDTIIGRYFDLTGFLGTIGKSKLRLTKIIDFDDKMEGIHVYTDLQNQCKRVKIMLA